MNMTVAQSTRFPLWLKFNGNNNSLRLRADTFSYTNPKATLRHITVDRQNDGLVLNKD